MTLGQEDPPVPYTVGCSIDVRVNDGRPLRSKGVALESARSTKPDGLENVKAILLAEFLQAFLGLHADVPCALAEAPIVVLFAWATTHVGYCARWGIISVAALGPLYK